MKTLATLVTLAIFALPYAASADQISDLQAQIQILTKILLQLQAQHSAGTAAPAPAPVSGPSQTAACPALTDPLGPGSEGVAVLQLQGVLTQAGFFNHALTMYYGSVTTAAVQQFQEKNGIASSGTPGYGSVGPKTLMAIKSLCSKYPSDPSGGVAPTSQTTGPVGGFIQVSPVSGSAPLYVNIQTTINTPKSCTAALYTIDFGDGSPVQQIPLSAGTCQSEQQTYTHTYATSGTYLVTLAAGGHQSSATVVVQ